MPTDWLWQGIDHHGIACFIAHEQWSAHLTKRIEIAAALDLTIRAMTTPDAIEPDKRRPDEAARYFRLLTVAAADIRPGYLLRVSVKYVRQPAGAWFKFYQSCWLERMK